MTIHFPQTCSVEAICYITEYLYPNLGTNIDSTTHLNPKVKMSSFGITPVDDPEDMNPPPCNRLGPVGRQQVRRWAGCCAFCTFIACFMILGVPLIIWYYA